MSDPPAAPEPSGRGAVPPTWQERIDLLLGGARPPTSSLVGVAVAVVAAVALFLLVRPSTPPPPELAMPMAGEATAATATTSPPEVVVHVAGAVVAPGVYRLGPGGRVADAVDAAGGPAPGADLHRLNLAAPLVDGAQVYVPRLGEPLPTAVTGAGPSAATGPVDLNLATAADLEALPGIGPATARAILAARDRAGRFASVEDLLDVRGIGPAKLEALRDLVCVCSG